MDRAALSRGASDDAIYRSVAAALVARKCSGTIVDVGCGAGRLLTYLQGRFDRYIGVDLIAYAGFPVSERRIVADVEQQSIPLASRCADVAVAVEVIEHLENPRAFVRGLTRLVAPGGWVVITTPNQRSALSLLTLAFRGRFAAFQDVNYPAHITALLDVDLRRIASECGLVDARIEFTACGRIPKAHQCYPEFLSRRFPAALSDNVLLVARTPIPVLA